LFLFINKLQLLMSKYIGG